MMTMPVTKTRSMRTLLSSRTELLRLIPVRGAEKNAPLGVRIHNMNVPILQFANKEIIRLRTELIAQIRKTAQAEEKAADLEDELERTKKMAAAHAAEPSTSDSEKKCTLFLGLARERSSTDPNTLSELDF